MADRPDLLKPGLVAALTEVGSELRAGGDPAAALSVALNLLAEVDPRHVAAADGAIAEAAELWRQPPQSQLGKLFARRSSAAAQLLRTPGLEYLFIFHRDGRLREAALLKITGGLPSAFLFAAVLWRLNDWAEPVRRAVERCAHRSFPQTDPATVARTAVELLVRQASWRRWGQERAIVDEVFSRADVAKELAKLMASAATGPQVSVLRYALRGSALDQHLEQLAKDAVQPSVRAVALDALINRSAQWPAGTAWRWIDKSMGLRRREPVFERRNLTVTPQRSAHVVRGLHDRSATVRKVALNGIIRHLLGAAEARDWASRLVADRSRSVREKAEFILKHEAA